MRGAGGRWGRPPVLVVVVVCLAYVGATGGEGTTPPTGTPGRKAPPEWWHKTSQGLGREQQGATAGPGKGPAGGSVVGEGVDWQAEAKQLREEKVALEEQVQKLRDENKALLDVRNGQQSTLDPFLFRRRQNGESDGTPGEADTMAEHTLGVLEDAEGMSVHQGEGAGGLVDYDTVNNVVSLNTKIARRKHPLAPSAASGAFHRPLTTAQAHAVAAAALEAVERELAAPPGGDQLAPASPVKRRSLGNANLKQHPFTNAAASSTVLRQAAGTDARAGSDGAAGGAPTTPRAKAEEEEVVLGASASVPFAQAIAKALEARHARFAVAGQDHHWEDKVVLARENGPVAISVREGARLLGAWELDGHGGSFRDGALCHEFGSCVNVNGGEWLFADCSVLSSGLAAVHDTVQHNSINTALYCAGASRTALDRTTVGGVEQGKVAFWGVFGAAESAINVTNGTVQYCRDSGCAAVGSSTIRLVGSVVEQCVVGVTADGASTVCVDSCILKFNDAAFECGFATASQATMLLRGNKVFGTVWNNADRPSRLEESDNILRKGTGVRRDSHISVETKSAADLRDSEDAGFGADAVDEEEEGLEVAAMRGARKAKRKAAATKSVFADENAKVAHAALSVAR